MGIDWTGKWRPLPDSLTVKESKIEGLGLFAKSWIPAGTNFGLMRIWIEDEWIRTALGSFSNHVDQNPTCINIEYINEKGYKCYYLKNVVDLDPGDELTLTYKMPEYHNGDLVSKPTTGE